jgi:hypothetical protein
MGVYTDIELSDSIFDVRCYDIIPLDRYKNNGCTPIAIVPIKVRSGKKYVTTNYPVFGLRDLDKLMLTGSNHLVLKSTLSQEQQIFIESHVEGSMQLLQEVY